MLSTREMSVTQKSANTMDATVLRRQHDEAVIEANRKLLESEALVDVTVTVGDVTFPCHRPILAAWSGYFRSMFSSDFTETRAGHVTLPEWDMVSPEAFALLHQWMYRGELNISLATVELILPTAVYLQMDKTADMLTDYMSYQYSRGVAASRMLQHLSLAHCCGVPVVRDMALAGLVGNFDAMIQEEAAFVKLPPEDLLALLRKDQLKAESEDTIFNAAFAWLRHGDGHLDYLHDVLKSLRVGLVSAGTIRKALDIEIMSRNSECCDILLDALAAGESDKKSLDLLKTDRSEMFVKRTHSTSLGQDSFRERTWDIPEPHFCEMYGTIWREGLVTLEDTCPDLTDVTVTVDGQDFLGHKAVLFGWGDYFQRPINRDVSGVNNSALSLEDKPTSNGEHTIHPGDQTHETVKDRSPKPEGSTRIIDSKLSEAANEEMTYINLERDSSPTEQVSLAGVNMTKTSFAVLLDWIYRGTLSVTSNNLCDVMMWTRSLQMDNIALLLIKYFEQNLTTSAGPEIVTMKHDAQHYDFNNVYETCVNQVISRFEEVCDSGEFNELLDVNTLLRVLQDGRLSVSDEDAVLQRALSWLRHCGTRQRHTGDVIKSVRLGLVRSKDLSDGLDFAFTSQDKEAFNLLKNASLLDSWNVAIIRKDHPEMFTKRRNKAFYDSLKEISTVGDPEGSGRLEAPHAVCVLGDLVLVADWISDRLVAFRRPEPAAKHAHVCHVDITDLRYCVSDKDTDTVYVCSSSGNITMVKWTQAEGLRMVGELTADGKLTLPNHMALDPRDKEHLYVACEDAVHKLSLKRDTVVTTLRRPSGVEGRPGRVAIIGSTLMVNYWGDKTLVLYTSEDTSGHVIRPAGLKDPFGLGEDGVNFLVGDVVDRCMYVIALSGETLMTVNTGNLVPCHITVDANSVYISPRDGDGHIHILTAVRDDAWRRDAR